MFGPDRKDRAKQKRGSEVTGYSLRTALQQTILKLNKTVIKLCISCLLSFVLKVICTAVLFFSGCGTLLSTPAYKIPEVQKVNVR